MIPQRLTLKNFLSYREATLDFRGLHTACICGANGAGKSSLLEAIAWAVWGESRAASEDDVIHIGTAEAQVDFIFRHHHHTYRVIRSRYRGQASSLEFQVAQDDRASAPVESQTSLADVEPALPLPTAFRTLTAKGVRATQQLILEHLKLDYETFVNSAYLRQGRADEFMLKRPTERKQILADLLKLDQYDELAERAKDQSRQFKGQIELLERQLETIQNQLQQRDRIAQEQTELEAVLTALQTQQHVDQERLQALQTHQQQRQTWQQQLTWQQQRQRTLTQDCQQLQQELATVQHQQQELTALLQQESTIVAGYQHFQALQAEDEQLSARFQADQTVQEQRQQYQQHQAAIATDYERQIQQIQAQLDVLVQQESEIQQTLSKSTDVAAALAQLQQARNRLTQLDQLQARAAPLLQRRQQVQTQLDRTSTRLVARLEELQTAAQQLQRQQERQPQLQQAITAVSARIATLEERRAYQQRVREKGLERRSFMERLQAHQRSYEAQLADLEQKVQLLRAVGHSATDKASETENRSDGRGEAQLAMPTVMTPAPTLVAAAYPPCPLCDRPLDEHHWHLVLEKHQTKQQEILDQIWVIREQLAASEREIQVLRQEYRELEHELEQYGTVLERRGQLQEQLQVTTDLQLTLQQVLAEAVDLERSLQTGDYAADLQEELRLLDQSLQQLNYDEKDHALARGEVDRWRWAEIRQAEIKQAQRRQQQLAQRQPELEAQLADRHQQLGQLAADSTAQRVVFDQQLVAIDYSLEQHNALRHALRQAQSWQLRYQELCRAHQQFPQLQQRLERVTHTLQTRQQECHAVQLQLAELTHQLAQTPDRQPEIQTLEQQIPERRSRLDMHLAQRGRLQQQHQQLEAMSQQQTTLLAQLQTAQRQQRIYQELAVAFGKNGIQALMIENALPQLEVETNHILSRLSGNQLHVQFVTQRSHRRDQTRTKRALQTAKLIETLDILIADAHGTRPYETYSGGEAFRVNFAIRLALARLLSQRSGTALQLLIVDEGFGTQDAEGCDRLIAAINAIAPDFACILTVTHVPHFKEAFQARIEVSKTADGSQVTLLA